MEFRSKISNVRGVVERKHQESPRRRSSLVPGTLKRRVEDARDTCPRVLRIENTYHPVHNSVFCLSAAAVGKLKSPGALTLVYFERKRRACMTKTPLLNRGWSRSHSDQWKCSADSAWWFMNNFWERRACGRAVCIRGIPANKLTVKIDIINRGIIYRKQEVLMNPWEIE